jgi:signal transduction histidine kinase
MRFGWPTLLLAVSIGLTMVGIIEATRAVRSQSRVAAGVVQDYSRVASWSYRQHLTERMRAAMREILGAVNHGDGLHTSPRIPEARELAHYLPMNASCSCHRPINGPSPAIFFGFTLGSDTLGLGVNTHPQPTEGWDVDRPMPLDASPRLVDYAPGDRLWINDTLSRQIRRGRGNDRFNFLVGERDGSPRFLAYTLMPTVRGDTIVYGAEYTHDAVTQSLADVLYSPDLLPIPFTRGRPVREVLQVEVRDVRGGLIFQPQRVSAGHLDALDTLPPSLGSIVVHAQVPSGVAEDVVIGGLPKSRLPFLLALLGIAAALTIVAVGQIRRDVELARLRGDFVSSVSHDLRTPLAQMRLYLETLRLGRFTTEAQRTSSIEHVERETMRLSHMVERVLRFSGNGKSDDGSRADVDVAAEVQRIVAEFQPLAASRKAVVVADIEQVPTIKLGPDALRHVLLNLLDNAIKYGPVGQTVRVRLERVGENVQLSVRDEGPGVAAADRERVWSPFQRGSHTGPVAGSGIGLAIVRDIATRHGGRAWIENGTSAGATFVVTLPLG